MTEIVIGSAILSALANLYIKALDCEYFVNKRNFLIVPAMYMTINIFLYKYFNISWKLFVYSILMLILIIIILQDVKHKSISYINLILLFTIVIILLITIKHITLYDALLGGIIAGGILSILYLVSGGGIGIGDILLFTIIGLYLGLSDTITALLVSAIISGIAGLCILLINRRNRDKPIPFTPFIMLGVLLAIVS